MPIPPLAHLSLPTLGLKAQGLFLHAPHLTPKLHLPLQLPWIFPASDRHTTQPLEMYSLLGMFQRICFQGTPALPPCIL